MRFNPIPVMAALWLALPALAQPDSRYNLYLRSGSITPSADLSTATINRINLTASRSFGKTSLVIQFDELPSAARREQLRMAGIELFDYIPNNAYLATVAGPLESARLTSFGIRALVSLEPRQKMQEELVKGSFPAHAVKVAGTVDVWAGILPGFGYDAALSDLRQHNWQVLHQTFRPYGIAALRVSASRLEELAGLPYIQFVQAVPGEDRELNDKSVANSRANVLKSALAGQRNLRGNGVVVGVGDNANPLNHIDFSGRLINRCGASGGEHGIHVSGTLLGGGILDERYEGYSPKATLIKQFFSGILLNAPSYVQDYGMVITNNSYGTIVECAAFGHYTMYSRVLDQQQRQYPHLQHVFAAGNFGGFTCPPYPPGHGMVMGDYQSAKNILTVGSSDSNLNISWFSSRGPVRDGRIKPEITAQGQFVISSWAVNWLSSNNGTSMAAPGVSGGLAQLYQRYRQLNGNANPKNILMKALICNGATDAGNPGPDYAYGFGNMNLIRSVDMLEAGRFYFNSIATAGTQDQTITVPANTARLKVMLYWNDPEASVLASQTLVNNLDLEVYDPSSNQYLPFILDTALANITNPATTGVDNINNIEQVVVTNPPAGNYTIRVKGSAVPQAPPQEYVVVYDAVPVSTRLTYPMGGEKFTPWSTVRVNWDSDGAPAGTCTLEYSSDGGSSWTLVANNIPTAQRQYSWLVPATPTHQGRLRFTHNADGQQTTTQDFVILNTAVVTLDAVQCEGHIAISWPAVSGATDYEVVRLMGDEMVPVAHISATSYVFRGLSRDTTYVVGVRPRINGVAGTRFFNSTVIRQPNTGTCAGAISDNDIQLDALLYPAVSGRQLTSTAFTSAETIRIRIRNLDDAATSGSITASYRINGGAWQNETVGTAVPATGTLDYDFITPADLSLPGTYAIEVALAYGPDTVLRNNSLVRTVRQLTNPAISLATPFLDDLESAGDFTYYGRQVGFNGADRYDFVTNTVFGRVRSYLNFGMAASGQKAFTLDADRYNAGGTTDSLTATFNLAAFNANTDDIRFDFRFKNHGQGNQAANQVWIRGNDQQNWIPVYNLAANQPAVDGSYKRSSDLELSDLLLAAGQNFSSSFQVRWGQYGQFMAADNIGFNGYSFDDIRLRRAVDDVQVLRIDAPVANPCNLTAATPVQITLRNTANNAVSNVPVSFSVDGGAFIPAETIASIAANTTVTYTFTATANLAAPGYHTVAVRAQLATDNVPENDTLSVSFINASLITVTATNPYLQDFETDNGGWYTEGANSSWEYGTPASLKINRAASGSKAWKTRLVGNYNDQEESSLVSPCFNVSGLSSPTLSFHVALDMEDCGTALCDAAYVEYSLDGISWARLGTTGSGTNWYNKDYSGNQLWSVQNYHRWHVATIPLSVIPVPIASMTQLRFRFIMSGDAAVNRDGIAIDDVHVYDNIPIYTGASMGSPVTQTIPGGSGWVNFIQGGQIVASVNAPVSMGSTDVQAFINPGPGIRTSNTQYYHDRNITIKPATTSLSDSALVRFYFTDTETEALIAATGCGYCVKPAMAAELGVTKYSDPDDSKENGSIFDNLLSTGYSFIRAVNVRKVPYDRGYYAEFKVRDFSEFWLNNGGPNLSTPLPLKLLAFQVRKAENQRVWVEWTTTQEERVLRYEVEMARGEDAYLRNQFERLGELPPTGNGQSGEQQYRFADDENGKSGVRYYRLKMIDEDGSFRYSPVRPVVFADALTWQVYPNPSNGIFHLVFQQPAGAQLPLRLYDPGGRLIRSWPVRATGFLQKETLDLGGLLPPGLYLLEAGDGDSRRSFRLLKQ